MSDTPQNDGETKDKTLQNDGQSQAPLQPEVKTDNSSEVERLRKELEQKTMRERQLENQLKAEQEAKEKAKAAELEEQQKFKELFEQEKAKREAIEAEREEAEQKEAVEKAKSSILDEYTPEVKTLAEEVGISLSEASEEAVAEYKSKLDKLNTRVEKTAPVKPNNNLIDNKAPELTPESIQKAAGNDKAFHDLVTSKFPGIKAMTNNR